MRIFWIVIAGALATAALEARAKVLELQQRNASERVRRALYALAGRG